MSETVLTQTFAAPPLVDERDARRALRAQIARLEADLAGTLLSAWPRAVVDVRVGGGRAARVQTLAELEAVRDSMADRLAVARAAMDRRGAVEEVARREREELLLHPELHPFARVTNEAVGEPGCRDWHVRPRFGLLGMLMRWWRVVVSSGCP
jgi:hypothetical protein